MNNLDTDKDRLQVDFVNLFSKYKISMRQIVMPPDHIPNYYAYKLCYRGEELAWTEKEMFIRHLNTIYKNNKYVVYRGDKKSDLMKRYGLNGNFPTSLSEALFFFGAKSRIFSVTEEQRARAIQIADKSLPVFARIFRMISQIFRHPPSESARARVDGLLQKDPKLLSFFMIASNESILLEKVATLDKKEQLRLRDNYLSLLHHIGEGEYYSSTFLLSASRSFSAASDFAGNKQDTLSQDSIIIIGWVPRGLDNVLTSLTRPSLLKLDLSIQKSGLPFYRKMFYPREEEITLKGGLFPHYIVGYLYAEGDTQTLEINPAMLEVRDNWDGRELPVDQSNWQERIRNTEFGAYFELNEMMEYNQFNV